MVDDRKCPNCFRDIPVDARACPYCKKELDESRSKEQRICPNCGRIIPVDARICPYCKKEFEITQSKGVYENSEVHEVKKHTGFGTASLVLGIIGMCFIWTTFLGIAGFAVWLFFLLPIGILSIILGAIGYYRSKKHDNYGIIGLILGVLLVILGFIFAIISSAIIMGRI